MGMELKLKDIFPERKSSLYGIPDTRINLEGKKIAISGGAGSIGSEIMLNLFKLKNSKIQIWDSDESRSHTLLVALKNNENLVGSSLVDIRDPISVNLAFESFEPDILIHAAALKHVLALEIQPREAFLTNVIGTLNILNCIKKFNLESSLFISSDKAADPSSVLGATKLIGERMWAYSAKTSSNNQNFSIVRFGNVFLSRGSVVETFLAQLKNSEPITITDPEMTRFFMDVDEAANLITYILDKKIAGLSVLKMGEPIAILELANRLAKFRNIKLETRIIGTKKGEKLSEILFAQSEHQSVSDRGFYLHSPFVNALPLEKIEGLNPKTHEEALRLIKELLSFQ